MRPLTRPAKPDILVRKEQEWKEAFLKAYAKNRSAKLPSDTYNHHEVRDALESMSKKCFYSETMDELHIDHYIEKSISPERAFDWNNLYLCNSRINIKWRNKAEVKAIHVTETIDPVNTSWEELEDDISIRGDFYSSIGTKGIKTIAKYGLNEEWICLQRSRAIQEFDKCYKQFLQQDNGKLTKKSVRLLRAFANEDKPFTFMFRCILKQHGLWAED